MSAYSMTEHQTSDVRRAQTEKKPGKKITVIIYLKRKRFQLTFKMKLNIFHYYRTDTF